MSTWITNIVLIIAFIALLAFGFMVSSEDQFAKIGSESVLTSLSAVLMYSMSWTVSNLILLSITSCHLSAELIRLKDSTPVSTPVPLEQRFRKSIVNGLVIFGTIFFAMGWVDVEYLLHATQELYFKLAGYVFFMGLASGFRPDLVYELAERFLPGTAQEQPPTQP